MSLQSSVEITAILNLFPYLDENFQYTGEKSLADIIYDNQNNFDSNTFNLLKNAIDENPSLGEIVLVNQSSTNGTQQWTDDLIQACTFRDADGNYYITYRGTGDGRWADNGKGMVAESTEMQEAAAAYFDEMAEKYLIDASLQGKEIIVSGHSKGGNEAQYVYMSAQHEEIIDKCISLDGQGFSEAAIEKFKNYYGDEYEEKLKDMYSINGQNDYVHDLGIVIIPEENTSFVGTSGNDIASYHALENMLSKEDGIYSGLSWIDPETGEPYKQGEIGELAKRISENMMVMNPDDREGTAIAVMTLVDIIFQVTNEEFDGDILKIGGTELEWTHIADLLDDGLPVLIDTLLYTEEGQAILKQLITGGIESLYKEYGVFGVAGGVVVGGLLLACVAVLGDYVEEIVDIIDFVADTIEKIEEIAGDIKQFISDVKDAVLETIDKITSKLKSYTVGGRYATSNPQIKVDTYKLQDYANRIQGVNRRIVALDKRLDSLYWNVGLLDLWNLMQADLLTGYSWRLNRCSNYLSETATEFITVENELSAI